MDDSKLSKLYKQEMDQLIVKLCFTQKKLTKPKNIQIEKITSHPYRIKRSLKDKLSLQLPLKIKRFEIKSTSKTRENFTNNTNFMSNDISKVPQNETENINTISALNTVYNNTTTSYIKDSSYNKEINDFISLVNDCYIEENSKKSLKLIQSKFKCNKNAVFLSEIIIEKLCNLFNFFFMKYKFKSKFNSNLVFDNELVLSKILLDELIINDEINAFKIKNS